ncbi:MAG TPA: alpha/beta hydrolase [Paracoccus sp.]|nr:alpha/beta hydrolase [Paracoccus sp. (in: a-proteobacteria)]
MFLAATGRRLAFERVEGRGHGVVFLHGFKSDMGGTKAVDLEAWCRQQGRAMLRFDLSGHGQSGGAVEDFGISDWLQDARELIDALAPGPQVLVGSSLGGWLALLLARERPERWAGLVTIAAAPDFTQRMQGEFTDADRAALARDGRVTQPSDYGEDYVFSERLFRQGAEHAVFAAPLVLPMPVRFLQGTADADVPMADALRLLDHAEGPDIRLTLVRGADHRFSAPAELALIRDAVAGICGVSGRGTGD